MSRRIRRRRRGHAQQCTHRCIGYGYDAALRFNWLADMAQKGTSVAYTKDHLPRTVTLPTGNISSQRLQLSLTYSAAHAPLSLGYNQLLDPTLGRRYGHDVLERITSIRRGIPFGSGTYQDETVRSALYDSLGRLSYYDDVRFWEEEGELVCPDPLDPKRRRISASRRSRISYHRRRGVCWLD